MTLVEVLVVLAVCAVMIVMVLPAFLPRRPPTQPSCMSRLRQIDIGVLMYADDNRGKLPMQQSADGAGTIQLESNLGPLPSYRMLSSYLNRADILICPLESQRLAVTNFNDLTQSNLSYFLNADVLLSNKPSVSILAGDRNLQANGRSVPAGLFALTTNLAMNWTRELHLKGGNLAFADGHVQFCWNADLNDLVQRQCIATNHLLVP